MSPTPDSTLADPQEIIADLQRQLAERTAERDEALKQQTATAEVLQVINSSPGDLTPVFEAMLETAARLCSADIGIISNRERDGFRVAATFSHTPEYEAFMKNRLLPANRGSVAGRAALERRAVQISDITSDPDYAITQSATLGNIRTALGVPLLREQVVVGVISLGRNRVQPFTDRQIALLENFAAQAVIAMVNARLITETREALEQQTATAEVLGVINSSPGDLAPVFEALLEKALHLCEASYGALQTFDGEFFRIVADRGDQRYHELISQTGPFRPEAGSTVERLVQGESVVQVLDLAADDQYRAKGPIRQTLVEIGGARTFLSVALRKDERLVGALHIYRQEVRPFTEKQIALLQNFAAQAVIAMENARLLGELQQRTSDLQESLEFQTATGDVLKLISRSVFDLQPVLETLAVTAARLCSAEMVFVYRREGEVYRLAANCGFPPEYEAFVRNAGGFDPRHRSDSISARAALLGRGVHIHDVAAEPGYPSEGILLGKIRTGFAVPLLREGTPIGVLGLARQRVEPFTDKQIELVTTFADQAAIAIENTRLITETREALEQQTATAEVLEVINSSPGDLAPVFDALLGKALRLCEAAHGVIRTFDGQLFHEVARCDETEVVDHLRELGQRGRGSGPVRPGADNPFGRLVQGERVVHIADLVSESDRVDPANRERTAVTGARTWLAIALQKEDLLLGAIIVHRREVRPFSDKQIALLRNFADQAVIAIENARLITETREALDQQTATAEVLQVINSSPGDLAPVFDAMLEKATALCEAAFGVLRTWDGERFHQVALRGVPPALQDLWREPLRPSPGTVAERIVHGETLISVADLREDPGYRAGAPGFRPLVEMADARSYAAVALRKDGALMGALTVYRQEVRPFTDKQIALLQNFAAQAVIAMENARLLGQLRDRTTDLEESLEYQTATSDVLQIISRSTFDLQPVLDTLVETAARLCNADGAGVATQQGDVFRYVATTSLNPKWRAMLRDLSFKPGRDTIGGRALLERSVAHVADIAADPEHAVPQIFTVGSVRTILAVPLLHEDEPIGVLTVARYRVQPFTERQIELVRTFADQAVIAIENARLITETREALEQQTATAEVLQVINSSPGDLKPVFDAILERALDVCEAKCGNITIYDGETFNFVAAAGHAEFNEWIRLNGPARPGPGTTMERMIRGERVVHIADIADDEVYRAGSPVRVALVEIGGFHTFLGVALRKDDALLGILHVYRQEVRPFTDKQIALLQNFAAQAVIAMENARLITETREALDQQTATAEVLGVINSSLGDLQPVFEAILERATHLCRPAFGVLFTWDGERFHRVAWQGGSAEAIDASREAVVPPPGSPGYRLVHGEDTVSIPDLTADEMVQTAPVRYLLRFGARSYVNVAMRKDDRLLGGMAIYRQEVRPFSSQEIALLRNFAAQAVIAMENARLLTETREALEQQTATAEVLGVINSSPGDLAPVFDVMLEKARRLCEATYGHLATYDGDRFYTAAIHGVPAPFAEFRKQNPQIYGPATPVGRLFEGEPIVQVIDCADTEGYRHGDPNLRAAVDLGGARTMLCVPLLKDDAIQGFITVYRQEVRPFTDKQIALLQNFAAQAVIAIENARLLDEVQQRQSELRVTFDNMADGVAMFDQTLHLAAWNRNFQELLQLPDTLLAERPGFDAYVRYLTERGEFGDSTPDTEIARLRGRLGEHYYFERTRPDGTVIEVRHNPMPDGGVVLIFSDITERKRSEEEIRAARDAAEAAYRDLQAAQANLVQAQKMAALGQLTAGIAHEIKNPLNFVNNFAALSNELLDELKEMPVIATLDEQQRAEIDETLVMLSGNLEKIAEHGQRADNIVKSMLEHSRGVGGERREVDLNDLVDEALNLAYHGARAQDASFNITLERDYAPTLRPIELAPQEMTRVFLNLIGNGFYATNKRAKANGADTYRPTLRVATHATEDGAEVRVRDNGTGIPVDIRDKLFQPFFTTKPTGEGTGLGLSISYDIVTQQHGGTITVESEPGTFTEFTVRLPRH